MDMNTVVRDPRYPDLEGKLFPGIILKGVGGIYWVELPDGREISATPRGIFVSQTSLQRPAIKSVVF